MNSWKKIHTYNRHRYNSVFFPGHNVLYLLPRNTINGMLYPKKSGSSLPNWKCMLRQCVSYPKYNVPDYESSFISIAPRIKFHQDILFSTCYIHRLIEEGRLRCNIREVEKIESMIRSIKMLILKELSITFTFIREVYLSRTLCKPLFKNICGELRHDACYFKPGNIFTIRDYVERISSNFNLEIQSKHFGIGRSLSIEGCIIEIAVKNLNDTCKLYSHFSDDSRQDTYTTHAYMISMIEELKTIS